MDHEQIAEENVVARYLMGRLTPDEEERFEEHLIECADCRRQVEQEEDFQGALRAASAAEEPAAPPSPPAAEVVPFRPRPRGGTPWWLLAAAALLLGLLPTAWLLRERARLQGEVAALRTAAERTPAVFPTPTPAPPPTGPSGDAERRELAAELQAERDARARLAEQVARLTRPQVNTPIFSLGLVRGGETAANRVTLGTEPGWLLLSVELPAETAPSYRATLATAGGRTVWTGGGLKPQADGTISISLYSTLLAPGAYRLRLEGVGGGSPPTEIPFAVAR